MKLSLRIQMLSIDEAHQLDYKFSNVSDSRLMAYIDSTRKTLRMSTIYLVILFFLSIVYPVAMPVIWLTNPKTYDWMTQNWISGIFLLVVMVTFFILGLINTRVAAKRFKKELKEHYWGLAERYRRDHKKSFVNTRR